MSDKKSIMLTVRVSEQTKHVLRQLVLLMGNELGTTVSQTQAIEIAIHEALRRRKEGN